MVRSVFLPKHATRPVAGYMANPLPDAQGVNRRPKAQPRARRSESEELVLFTSTLITIIRNQCLEYV